MKEIKQIQAISVNVYRWSLGDCTNHGFTENHDTIYVPCPHGPDRIDEDDPALFKLVIRNIMGKEYRHLEPYTPCPSDRVGYMAGGNIGYSCDSRFSEYISQYPLKIFDRCETQEEYDALSR